mmetsp:Transcript_6116/g.15012  ORF Transcript_6116/g.15012 Transcript_6116/m.15012 type:complete len:92 (-) Transcript_6116:180-455(-)
MNRYIPTIPTLVTINVVNTHLPLQLPIGALAIGVHVANMQKEEKIRKDWKIETIFRFPPSIQQEEYYRHFAASTCKSSPQEQTRRRWCEAQ